MKWITTTTTDNFVITCWRIKIDFHRVNIEHWEEDKTLQCLKFNFKDNISMLSPPTYGEKGVLPITANSNWWLWKKIIQLKIPLQLLKVKIISCKNLDEGVSEDASESNYTLFWHIKLTMTNRYWSLLLHLLPATHHPDKFNLKIYREWLDTVSYFDSLVYRAHWHQSMHHHIKQFNHSENYLEN